MARPLPKKPSYSSQVRQYLTGITSNSNLSSSAIPNRDRTQDVDKSRQYRGESRQDVDIKNTGVKYAGGGGFNMKQNIFFWFVTSAMIFAAFVIGFKSGQKRGALEVLDQASNQMVRLPIVRPVGSDLLTVDLERLQQGKKPQEKLPEANPQDKVLIDFSNQAQPTVAVEPPVIPVADPKKELLVKESTATEKQNKEASYEVIYPGKGKFPPPLDKTKTVENTESKFKIDPLPSLAPSVEVAVKKEFDVASHSPSPGWYVQVAAVPSLDEVEGIYNNLTDLKLGAKIESADIRNKPYYRVLVGPFKDREEALDKRLSTKSSAGTTGEPFIRQVK